MITDSPDTYPELPQSRPSKQSKLWTPVPKVPIFKPGKLDKPKR